MSGRTLLGIDVGGTFTDLVFLDEAAGRLATAKVLTTPADPSLGALRGVDRLLADGAGLGAGTITVHGTTLVSNTLIERSGPRTGLITTRGFRDVLEFVGRELRYDMYDANIAYPEPLVPRDLRVEVDERVDGGGVTLVPLDEASAVTAIETLRAAGVEAIAVSLINSFLRPDHERRLRELIAQHAPGVAVSLSCEVLRRIREYERTSATTMNAYVQPVMAAYLTRLEAGLAERGLVGELHLMTSTGGTITRETAERFPLQLVESGPAAGTLAAAFVAARAGLPDLLSFDMGGTTAKAAVIRAGRPLLSHAHEVMRVRRFRKGSGLPIGIPVIDLIEIGAGGGSIAWLDPVGLLRVGPRSAGADPGPACYGLGGSEPTVTDADLVLGFLDPLRFLGGELVLDRGAAERAIEERVARPLGLDVGAAAAAIHRVVTESMAEAARVHAVEVNVDVRRYGIVAFGGAGPVHAYEVARLVRSPFVLCPANAGVLSALGLLVAPITFEASLTAPEDAAGLTPERVRAILAGLRAEIDPPLARAGVTEIAYEASAEMSYIGQGFEVATPVAGLEPGADVATTLKRAFDDAYERRYARRLDALPAAGGADPVRGRRDVVFPYLGTPVSCTVYSRDALAPGATFAGPALVEERNSTAVVPPGARATVRDDGSLVFQLGFAEASV